MFYPLRQTPKELGVSNQWHMADRDRGRDRDRDRDRERDRELREKDRRRDKEERDRDRDRSVKDRDRDRSRRSRSPDRSKRSRSPDRTRSRHFRSRTRSPDPNRSRSRSADRARRRHRGQRTPSPSPPRKRHRRGEDEEKERQRAAVVSDFVDGIAKEQQKQRGTSEGGHASGGDVEMDADEMELMKKMGIPCTFDSTKGKPVPGADVSGVRSVTKRQPRQYMNRRGGFNRPLPAERNR